MNPIASQRELWLFAGCTTIVALVVVLVPLPALAWVVDALTALVAGAAAIAICVRLCFAPNQMVRGLWLAALLAFAVTGLCQLTGIFGDAGAVRIAGYPALAVALVLVGLLTRRDSMPRGAAGLLWLGFAFQAASFIATLRLAPSIADLVELAAVETYLLGIAWCAGHLRWRAMTIERGPQDVGDLARYLFATSGLFKKVRHPRIGNFTLPGHKAALIAVRFLTWFPVIAPRVRRKFGIGLWRQFRDLWTAAIRHGLDAQVYYMFELYRPERRARTSGYLTRYELKNGLYKVLTWQVSKTQRRIMLGDKLGMTRICEENGIPAVPILLVADDGNLDFRGGSSAELRRDLFLKPRQSKGSRGAEFIRYAGGTYTRENGATLGEAALIAFIAERSREVPLLVQPRIVNHPDLAELAELALIRIRVITCQDDEGEPVLTHAVLSNLCKLELNWPTDIELGAMVDLDSGALGLVTGDKAEAWMDWSEDHPITRARVLGRIVPCWEQVKSICLAAHRACNDRLLIGWDIAVGPEGAVLLEGNSYPDVDFLQRSHRCGIGDSLLGPLLYSRLIEIERRSASGTLRGPMDFDPEPDGK